MYKRFSLALTILFTTILWSGLSLRAETEVRPDTPEYDPQHSESVPDYVPDVPIPDDDAEDSGGNAGTPDGSGGLDPIEDAEGRQDMLAKARQARTLELAGGVATGAAAVYLFTQCEAGAIHMCMFAMMAAQQSVSLFQMAGQSNQSIQDLLKQESPGNGSGSGGGAPSPEGDGRDPGPTTLSQAPEVSETLTEMSNIAIKLRKKGYSVDGRGNVRGPNGQSLAAGSMGSASAMRANGLSEAEIEAVGDVSRNAAKHARDRLRAVAVGIESGSGGRRPATARPVQANSVWRADTPKRGVASVEGMHRRLGNDRIGVAGDKLFDMIHRSYQNQRQKGAVLE